MGWPVRTLALLRIFFLSFFLKRMKKLIFPSFFSFFLFNKKFAQGKRELSLASIACHQFSTAFIDFVLLLFLPMGNARDTPRFRKGRSFGFHSHGWTQGE
jgi:hypothetical protein